MPVELSPIVPLLAGLDAKQRETSLSVGASVHHPQVCAMLYEDQHGAVWCIRLNGPGLPVFQDDWFQSYAKIAVLV
ncbi:hypothetical protein [Acidithiobacillus thiooxidans]|uniref:Uncharacterized protein n=1 Tax=Acidithiobacillus thiooxidans ATCC 19377 TaxID=637390 RepID=A0A543Q5L8_ACITH|nr:hypothetical protein [Acidithiobacillus thiooxidans]MDX5934169.1 hypothetical protein [Acidithiobacillus thiooxidans]TQN51612.1 hypothetical protein DLNHIDIE_01489 [Acidithiobacillus thiooxidans ATCC 19377]